MNHDMHYTKSTRPLDLVRPNPPSHLINDGASSPRAVARKKLAAIMGKCLAIAFRANFEPPQTTASLFAFRQLPFSDSAGRDNDLVRNSDVYLERTRFPDHGQSVTSATTRFDLNPAEAVLVSYIDH
jgi:succinylarginine dihydrolase